MFSTSKSNPQKRQDGKVTNGALISVGKNKKLLQTKETTLDGNKRRLPNLKKASRVEVLDSAKVNYKQNLQVKVESETTHVNVLERIKNVAGIASIPQGSCQAELNKQRVKSIQHLSYENKLHQPTFQSSAALMEDLDKLKHLEIETKSLLLLKVEKDRRLQNALNKKVSTVLNTSPSEFIFSRLQPISFNVEQMMNHDELRIQHLAEKYAPKKRNKDPEVCLKDFLQCIVIAKNPNLPESSFLEQCYQYHINPFIQHSVSEDNNLIPYSFWFA